MSAPAQLMPRLTLAVAAMIVILGLALRIYAALGDFWLDEIWSLAIAREAKSFFDLVHFKVDNNHLLNTACMRALGEQAYWPMYRAPAIAAGVVSIIVAGMLARRWGSAAMFCAMALVAVSHPLVHYGSEARGYSLAIMFMLLALWLQTRRESHTHLAAPAPPFAEHARFDLSRRIVLHLIAYWLCIALGMLSHPLFLQPYLAMIGWSLWSAVRDKHTNVAQRTIRLVASHLPPLSFAAWLYAVHWNGMQVGGGEVDSRWRIIAGSLALMLGWPRDSLATLLMGGAIGLGLVIAGLWRLMRRRDDFAVFALLAIFIAPALMLLITRPAVLYERYFLLPMTVGLLLIAILLGGLARTRGYAAIVALIVLSMMALNVSRDLELIARGRGQYLAAMENVAANTPGAEPIRIASDHDFRNQMVIEFYSQYLGGRPVEYMPENQRSIADDVQWFITHDVDRRGEPSRTVSDRFGAEWKLAARFDTADLSGWRWFVYHRAPS